MSKISRGELLVLMEDTNATRDGGPPLFTSYHRGMQDELYSIQYLSTMPDDDSLRIVYSKWIIRVDGQWHEQCRLTK